MIALCHGQLYQKSFKKAFDNKMRSQEFKEGGNILPIQKDSLGKWTPNYEGVYVMKNAFSGGALIPTTMDEDKFLLPVNSDVVKKTIMPKNKVKTP